MYEVIISNNNLNLKKISLKDLPVYSKQVAKTEKIEEYFSKNPCSAYNKNEQEAILIPFDEFFQSNKKIVEIDLKYRVRDRINGKLVFTGEKGVYKITNMKEYTVIYDIESGYIGITKTENIIFC